MLQCEGFIQLQLCDAVFLMIREGFIQVYTHVSVYSSIMASLSIMQHMRTSFRGLSCRWM